jgi:hypothetical protein
MRFDLPCLHQDARALGVGDHLAWVVFVFDHRRIAIDGDAKVWRILPVRGAGNVVALRDRVRAVRVALWLGGVSNDGKVNVALAGETLAPLEDTANVLILTLEAVLLVIDLRPRV